MILIIGQSGDPHIESVMKYLDPKKVAIFYRYCTGFGLTYECNGTAYTVKVRCAENETKINADTVRSVWWRTKPILKTEVPGGFKDVPEAFLISEWKSALASLEQYLDNALWVNRIDNYIKCSRKPYQLKLAQQCGLYTPRTVITNNPDDVLGLFKEGRVIYKTLSSFATPDEVIYTNEITKKDVSSNKGSIALAPGIFQTLIEKKHELRITIVGRKIFTLKVDSQDNVATQIDWRHQQYSDMFSPGALSQSTSEKLLKFHTLSGLKYATYDFIVDKSGREIFLECNPSGQWLLSDIPFTDEISKAFANCLSNPLNTKVNTMRIPSA